LGKTASDDSSIPLNALFQDDSSDSGDLDDQLDEFFHFMGWNDLFEEVQGWRESKVLSLLRTFSNSSIRPPE